MSVDESHKEDIFLSSIIILSVSKLIMRYGIGTQRNNTAETATICPYHDVKHTGYAIGDQVSDPPYNPIHCPSDVASGVRAHKYTVTRCHLLGCIHFYWCHRLHHRGDVLRYDTSTYTSILRQLKKIIPIYLIQNGWYRSYATYEWYEQPFKNLNLSNNIDQVLNQTFKYYKRKKICGIPHRNVRILGTYHGLSSLWRFSKLY